MEIKTPMGDKILVAMSGGVDSSVAAALLKEQGYVLTGVTMKIWNASFPVSEGKQHGCYGPGESEDIDDAKRVAGILGIPFHVIDLTDQYKTAVLDYFSQEYLSGRTPNPCVRCNRNLKFGALIDEARKAGLTFDRVASGHYAKIGMDTVSGRYLLRKAIDEKKDQTYFLAFLSQDQLSRLVLPLGNYTKTEVRRLAARFNLPVAQKPDSQNFVSGDYAALIEAKATPGPIKDAAGRVLGEHRGIQFYTVGQHRGLAVAGPSPFYVTAINACQNTIYVGPREELFKNNLTASEVNWISIPRLGAALGVQAKVRSSQNPANATLSPLGADKVRVEFEQPQLSITPGQAVVFYDGDVVVGGGIIDHVD